MTASKKETYNWPWILGTLLAGLMLIGLAHLGDLVWSWPPITTGSITNVGAAFVIAFLLFIAERRFTRNITRTVTATAEATAGAAAQRVVEERTTGLNDRVASLEEELAARRAATQQRQDESVEALASELTEQTARGALEEMIKVGAVREGLVVSGSRESKYPLISIQIEPRMAGQGFMYVEPDEVSRELVVSAIAEPSPGGVGVPYFGWNWGANESFADVMAQIDANLRQSGRMKDAKLLDPAEAAAQFSRAMALVKADQQAPLGEERVRGTLLELYDDDWAITTEGLQHLSNGFFATWGSLGIRTGWSNWPVSLPNPPKGVPAGDWPFLYGRLKRRALDRG